METSELIKLLEDRYEGFELAELLELSATDIAEAFPEQIEERMGFLCVELGILDDEEGG